MIYNDSLLKQAFADGYKAAMCEVNSEATLSWRNVQKELPVTPFLAYWTDGKITVLEEGDRVSYAITSDPEKRIIGWIPLSEIGKPVFA